MTIDIRNLYEQNIKYLTEKYNKAALFKKECANELGFSTSTLDNHIANNEGIPNYIKLGTAKNSRIAFPITEVAKFLSNTVEVDNDL